METTALNVELSDELRGAKLLDGLRCSAARDIEQMCDHIVR